MAKKMADFFGKAGKPLLNIFLFLVVPLCIAAVSRRYDYNSAWGKTVRFLISPAIVNTLMAAGYLTVLFIRVLRAKLKPELLDGFGIFMLFYIGLRVPQDFLTSIAGFYFTPLSILYLMILLSCMVYYKGSEHAASVIKKIALYMKKKASGTGNVLKKTSEKSIKAIGETSKTSIQKVASIKDKRKKSVIVAGIAVLVLLGAWLGGVIVGNAFVRVISISPSGEVDSEIMITAQFSAPVKLKRADTSTPECFTIKPPLKGKYSFENGKTVIFTPQEPLRPATDYEVSMNASKYFTAAGRVIISDKKTKFNTPYLKVADSRMFFTMDLMKNTEKEAVCEVNYNYPVDINELKKHVSVTKVSVAPGNVFAKKETTEQFLVEASEEPSRFYIRIPGIERTYENQTIKLKIEKGIQCASCGNPTKDIFEDSAEVPLRPKLNVEELRPWNTQGETSLAVRFNIPVTEEQVKKYVTVIKRGGLTTPPEPVKFTVKTEYCYALFTADFKPNISYEVAVSKAMKGKNGEIMDADYTDTVKLKDLPSSMEFSERGEVLSTAGSMNIGVKVMNLDRIFVRVHKVFKNNLVSFLQNRSIYNNASEVFSAYHDIKGGEINREETEYINLQKLNNAPYKGLFYVEIQDPKNYNSRNKVVRCTDISLIAKAAGGNNGDLIVKAISISTLQPMTGINVKLISHNNQVIKESKTDENGRVVFGDWHHNMYNFTPYLVLAENGDDFSYLTFGETQLNKYRFDVSGEPPSSDRVRAFITSERGLYRPGDTVNLTAIVRNADISTPPSMTVRCIVRGPSGESVFDAKKATDANSICLFRIELPSYAKTGQYSAVLMPNDYLTAGECTFKVEEFIPDKLVVGITSDRLEVLPGSSLTFKVKGNQMFGPPAAGNRLSSEVEFTSYLFRSKTYKDYFFSDPERDYSSKTERLGDGNLDDNGEKTYNVIVPKSAKPPSMLVANVYSEVFDDGGRAVGAYASVPVHIYNYYLGVKLKEAGKIYKRGDRVELDIVAVNRADALQKIKDVEVIVKRKVYYSIFRRSVWDRDSYNTSAYEEVLIYRTIDIDGKASLAFDADVEGEYKVYIGNEQRMRTGIDINVTGPGFTTFDMTKADRVTMALDREKYMPGDTATLTMNVPFDGYVYLTLENSKVVYERYLPVANGSVTARIPVLESYMPNIYVNAIAVRKPSEKYLSMPFSAYGIANLEIDKTAKDLKPRIECTEEVMSNAGIKVSIGNLRPGTAAVLAAVDEGILQIIRFKTPDPLEFFYRKRSMDTTSYTMLNSLLTDITAKKQAVGGDSYAGMQKHLNPVQAKNVESFAKFSGLVYADDTGTINYTFDTEKFNGKARVMALCVKNDMFGAADKYVNVVDPIVITPTLPRFLALNDEFFLPVRIYNNTGADAEFDFEAALKGPVSIENSRQKIAIPSKGEVVVSLRCRAGNEAGAAKFYFKASGNGQEMSVERELAVRPAARPETKVYRGVLEPGKNFSVNIPANYIKYGKKAGVYLNYSRVGEYAAAFDYLINYPYGCVEQTVSAAFPLLYYKDLGLLQRIMEERGSNTDYFINEAIRKIKQFVMSDGRIEFWPGSGYIVPEWISLYTANFLIEARLHGYAVEDELYNRVLAAVKLSPKDRNMEVQQSRLDRRDENAEDQGYQEGDGRGEYAESGGGQDGTDVAERNTLSDSMYRFYLKTLLNTPDTEKMAYYEELYAIHLNRDRKQGELLKNLGYNAEKIKMMENSLQKTDMLKGGLLYKYANEFAGRLSETDRFLLSMGYSQYNNREAAKMVIYDDFKTKFMARELGGMFNSPARNLGMYLKAISQAEGKPSARIDLNEDALLRMLRDDGSFGSTQETAWALMGLASADRAKAESGVINAGISVNGAAYSKQAGVTGVTMKDSKGLWKDISVENEGKNRFYYNVYVEGVPAEKNKATVSKGMKVYRKYFNEDGSEANLTSVKQGRLVIVSVTVEALSGRTLDNVVIVDMLPAGFEIENPRLKTRGRLSFTPEANFNAAFEDIRDDRMILFTKQFSGSQTFSYSVRAVTPGRFTVPNVYAEAMYDPELVAETYEDKYLVVAPALASGR